MGKIFGELRLTQSQLRFENGLGLRITKKGTMTYVCKYYFAGKAYIKKIARFEHITMDKARDICEKMKMHASNGIDPLTVLRALLELSAIPINDGITWRRMRAIYIDNARERKESWRKDESRLRRHTSLLWDNRTVLSITRKDVKDLFSKISRKTPIEANRLLEDLSSVFRVAREEGFISQNHISPVLGIKSNPEDAEVEFIRKDQMAKIAEAMRKQKNCPQLQCLKLNLYLGVRISACRNLKWEWIDFEAGAIYFPKQFMKRRKSHVLPLTEPARRLLDSISRTDSPYVFPGKMNGMCIASVQKQWHKIRTEAGYPRLRVNSLRHTVGTWMLHQTGDLRLVGDILHHTNTKTTQRYAKHYLGSIKNPFENYALSVEAFLEGTAHSP